MTLDLHHLYHDLSFHHDDIRLTLLRRAQREIQSRQLQTKCTLDLLLECLRCVQMIKYHGCLDLEFLRTQEKEFCTPEGLVTFYLNEAKDHFSRLKLLEVFEGDVLDELWVEMTMLDRSPENAAELRRASEYWKGRYTVCVQSADVEGQAKCCYKICEIGVGVWQSYAEKLKALGTKRNNSLWLCWALQMLREDPLQQYHHAKQCGSAVLIVRSLQQMAMKNIASPEDMQTLRNESAACALWMYELMAVKNKTCDDKSDCYEDIETNLHLALYILERKFPLTEVAINFLCHYFFKIPTIERGQEILNLCCTLFLEVSWFKPTGLRIIYEVLTRLVRHYIEQKLTVEAFLLVDIRDNFHCIHEMHMRLHRGGDDVPSEPTIKLDGLLKVLSTELWCNEKYTIVKVPEDEFPELRGVWVRAAHTQRWQHHMVTGSPQQWFHMLNLTLNESTILTIIPSSSLNTFSWSTLEVMVNQQPQQLQSSKSLIELCPILHSIGVSVIYYNHNVNGLWPLETSANVFTRENRSATISNPSHIHSPLEFAEFEAKQVHAILGGGYMAEYDSRADNVRSVLGRSNCAVVHVAAHAQRFMNSLCRHDTIYTGAVQLIETITTRLSNAAVDFASCPVGYITSQEITGFNMKRCPMIVLSRLSGLWTSSRPRSSCELDLVAAYHCAGVGVVMANNGGPDVMETSFLFEWFYKGLLSNCNGTKEDIARVWRETILKCKASHLKDETWASFCLC
eukprot:PhF_6_TR19012/c0_g1_i2/m.27873